MYNSEQQQKCNYMRRDQEAKIRMASLCYITVTCIFPVLSIRLLETVTCHSHKFYSLFNIHRNIKNVFTQTSFCTSHNKCHSSYITYIETNNNATGHLNSRLCSVFTRGILHNRIRKAKL